jgi:histidyl-tRNA synthetase
MPRRQSTKKQIVVTRKTTKKSIPLKKNTSRKMTSTQRKGVVKRKIRTSSVQKQPMQCVRGMRDILPDEYMYWTHVYKALEKAIKEFGFQKMELPIVEFSAIYKRAVGEGTDIVDKELYEFETRGGDLVALRPEMSSGLVRSFIEHGMHVWAKPIKLYTCGSLFRYDRPQSGRYREHRQANFDILGEADPILDAQLIQMASRVLSIVGLKNVQFFVNTLGNNQDRKAYSVLLRSYFKSQIPYLCDDCKNRLKKNILRILDCKKESCQEVVASAPQITDHLSPESHKHFKYVLEYLDELSVPYTINPFLVRGLDYYNDTVFEVACKNDNSQEGSILSLGGGGRYDTLVEKMGGEATPAVGFGMGLERIVLEMQKQETKLYQEPKPKVFLVQLGEMAKKKSLTLFERLEKGGILVAESFGKGNLKGQLRQASKLNAELTLILGQKEVMDQTVIVKDMRTGSQETVPQEALVEFVKKALKKNAK